jgi:hypothetical protein
MPHGPPAVVRGLWPTGPGRRGLWHTHPNPRRPIPREKRHRRPGHQFRSHAAEPQPCHRARTPWHDRRQPIGHRPAARLVSERAQRHAGHGSPMMSMPSATAATAASRRHHAFTSTEDVAPSRPSGRNEPNLRTDRSGNVTAQPGGAAYLADARHRRRENPVPAPRSISDHPKTSPAQKTYIRPYSNPPAHAGAVRCDTGPHPPAWHDAPPGRQEPCGWGSPPGRAILDKSPNRPASPLRRLIIESTYPL